MSAGDRDEVKVVLVQYQNSNKRIRIPFVKSVPDSVYLEGEFRRLFHYSKSGNVRIQVSLQRYDSEWGEYVDLEKNEDVKHKEKLRAVVLPSLHTPTESVASDNDDFVDSMIFSTQSQLLETPSTPTVILSENEDIVPARSRRRKHHLSDDEEEKEEIKKPKHINPDESQDVYSQKHDLDDSFDKCSTLSQSSSASGSAKRLRGSVSKEDSDKIPLPDPFPLPKNYKPSVENGLELGQLTVETRRSFLSSVASAMYAYKKYPTRDDYNSVARSIVSKYPFMKAVPPDPPYGVIIQSLINRFKEFRRQPKRPSLCKQLFDESTVITSDDAGEFSTQLSQPAVDLSCKRESHSKDNKAKKPVSAKKQFHEISSPPEIPSGEDKSSFERHNSLLKNEFKKRNRDMGLVCAIMEASYAMRRCDILKEPRSLETTLTLYPFLQEPDQLIMEMGRIMKTSSIKVDSRTRWLEFTPKIIQQAKLESHSKSKLKRVIQMVDLDILGWDIVCLILLPYMVPDHHSKPDHKMVINAVKEDEVESATSFTLNPFVLIQGTFKKPESVMLVIDSKVVMEVTVTDNVPLLLLSAYFVFDICYPNKCNNLFELLGFLLLGIPIGKDVNQSVKNLMTIICRDKL